MIITINYDSRTMSGVSHPVSKRMWKVNDSFPTIRHNSNGTVEVHHAASDTYWKLKDTKYGSAEWATQRGLK